MKSCESCIYSASTLEQGLSVMSCEKSESVIVMEGFGTSRFGAHFSSGSAFQTAIEENCVNFN